MQILTGEEKCKELEVHVYILLFANVTYLCVSVTDVLGDDT